MVRPRYSLRRRRSTSPAHTNAKGCQPVRCVRQNNLPHYGSLCRRARHESDRLESKPDRARAQDTGARLVGKSDLMAESDAISLHMVPLPRSRAIIGAEDIGRMKKGAMLINTSRGPLIDEGALVRSQGR